MGIECTFEKEKATSMEVVKIKYIPNRTLIALVFAVCKLQFILT